MWTYKIFKSASIKGRGGERLFAGFDTHKNICQTIICTKDGALIKQGRIKADKIDTKILAELRRRNLKYETGGKLYQKMKVRDLIEVALDKEKPDLVLKYANLVNVSSGEIYEADIAISRGLIVGLGRYDGKKEIDARNKYAVPGLIDGHTHIEMSMLSVSEFSKSVVPRGTTAVVEDPHEIANVLGVNGVKMILEEAKTTPLKVFCMAPSCVPSTNPDLNIETSGAKIGYEEVKELLQMDGVTGLAEMMDYSGVLAKKEEVWKKIEVAKRFKVPVDGHYTLPTAKNLNAYVLAGIGSDHESVSFEEALQKLRLGMRVMIREGSKAKNMKEIAPLLKDRDTRNCLLVTDGDRIPKDLKEEGYLDHVLRRAIEEGVDPVKAVQMCTINPAMWFCLDDIGSISPGKVADVVLLKELERFEVHEVLVNGNILDDFSSPKYEYQYPKHVKNTIRIKSVIKPENFEIKVKNAKKARIIGIREDELLTDEIIAGISGKGIDAPRDILKIAVIERHHYSGNIGLGFVKGFGIKRGAVASSISHDSHNIIVIGANEEDMALACNRLKEIGGGIVLCEFGEIRNEMRLPIAGLMSDKGLEEVLKMSEESEKEIRRMGCSLRAPFISLSFLALPVIPKLKITDKGLVNVEKKEIVSLFLE